MLNSQGLVCPESSILFAVIKFGCYITPSGIGMPFRSYIHSLCHLQFIRPRIHQNKYCLALFLIKNKEQGVTIAWEETESSNQPSYREGQTKWEEDLKKNNGVHLDNGSKCG